MSQVSVPLPPVMSVSVCPVWITVCPGVSVCPVWVTVWVALVALVPVKPWRPLWIGLSTSRGMSSPHIPALPIFLNKCKSK